MNKILNVHLNDILIGKIAPIKNNLIALEYDEIWIKNGFSIFPLQNKMENRVYIPDENSLNGLFGIFNDSLPWGFGKVLVDKMLVKHKLNPEKVNNISRLAFVGKNGLGALSYTPEYSFPSPESFHDFDEITKQCQEVLANDSFENIDELFLIGGTLGGFTPKITTKMGDEDWIIKFKKASDVENMGEIEYNYSILAKECGISMPETMLYDSKSGSGFFCIKRFDRNEDNKKLHTITASGLLETDYSEDVDYNTLMKLTLELTKSYEEVEKLFRLMCFNVFLNIKNDHLKKFAFIYSNENCSWSLSPAFGLKPSNCETRMRSTSVNGSQNPDKKDLLGVAKNIGMSQRKAKAIIEEIKEKSLH